MSTTCAPGPSRPLTFTGRVRSVACAVRGVGLMVRTQHNAWIHAVATVVVAVLGACASLSRAEWCLVVLAIVSVWTAEALNTAVELLTDVASPSYHPIAGKARKSGTASRGWVPAWSLLIVVVMSFDCCCATG